MSLLPLLLIEIGKLLAKMVYFRRIVDGDIRIVRMERGVVFVIGFGFVEGLQWNYLRHDTTGERFSLIKLRYVGLGDVLLFLVGEEDGRAVLRAGVRSLAIELCGIVRH